MRLRAANHPLSPPVLDGALRNFSPVTVKAVERSRCHVEIELRPVCCQRLAEPIEHFNRRPARIVRRFHHQWRYGADQHGFRHANLRLSVLRHVSRYLSAAGRVTDMHHIVQVQMFNDGGDIGGVVVHIMAVADLIGAAVTTTVRGDDTETFR